MAIACLYCGFDGEHKLLKTWRYRWWDSYFYEHAKRGGRFRYQVDPGGKRRAFVMKGGRK